MLDPTSIRSKHFALVVSGYDPEWVDEILETVATLITRGEDPSICLANGVSPDGRTLANPGYDPVEVDAYFIELAGAIAADERWATAIDSHQSDDPLPDRVGEAQPPAHADGDTTSTDVEDRDGSPDEDDAALEPDDGVAVAVSGVAVAPSFTPLTEAIERGVRTLTGLEAFVQNELESLRLACDRQVALTQSQCDEAIEKARRRADKLQKDSERAAAKRQASVEREAEQRRAKQDRELQADRKKAEKEIATLRLEADREVALLRQAAQADRAAAKAAVDRAVRMQAAIAESLAKARSELIPPDELAA
jgi:hypothetical protein